MDKSIRLTKGQLAVYNYVLDPNSEGRVIVLKGIAGSGKALRNDQLVLTETGFKPIGDLEMSDKVYSEDGKLYNLIGIYPQGVQATYKVCFKDGTYSICSSDHLWNVLEVKVPHKGIKTLSLSKILSTKYAIKCYDKRYDTYQNSYKYAIPFTKPIEFKEQQLILDPYVLGVLLGDGCFRSRNNVKLTVTKKIDLERFISNLPKGYILSPNRRIKANCYDTTIIRSDLSLPGFEKYIRTLGLSNKLSTEKHIPREYLLGSVSQREALLQGLLDTDGYTSSSNGRVLEYSTSSEQLAKDFLLLARSLGKYYSIHDRIAKIYGTPKSKNYRLRELKANGKSIVDIVKLDKAECTCIAIDSPTKTFITNDYNVTHNTTVVSQIIKDYKGSILVTATTHKAKNNLQTSIGIKAYTTHSALGFNMVRNGIEQYLSDVREPLQADLLIIDEMSMLPNKVYQKALNGSYKRILLVGDECQLPAIGLRADIKPDVEFTLTEQMRQSADDLVLHSYLESLRSSIKAKQMPNFREGLPENILLYSSHKDFCRAYLDCTATKRILAYSNSCIDSYNRALASDDLYSVGDLLVLDKPIGYAKNGDIVEVYEANQDTNGIWHIQAISNDGETLSFKVTKNKKQEKCILDTTLRDDPDSYWQVSDQYMHPKHIYASTIHKAQGMTLDEVFIDATDVFKQLTRKPTKYNNYNRPISIEEFLKLMYVAISRMRYKAHLYVGETRNYKYLKDKK